MNAVTVPSDTRVRARLERESQERGEPKEGAASGVRRTEEPMEPHPVWQATISADEPAGNVNGPAMGQTERVQAGADPSAQRIHKENWRARHGSGAGESCTISLSHRRQAHRGLRSQTSFTPRWPRERRPPSPAPRAALARLLS